MSIQPYEAGAWYLATADRAKARLAEAQLREACRALFECGADAVDIELMVREFFFAPDASGMRYDEYLESEAWQEQRTRAIRRAESRCQGCDTQEHLEAHHRTYENLGQELAGDLTVLCSACHTAVHLVADGRRGKIRDTSRRARA